MFVSMSASTRAAGPPVANGIVVVQGERIVGVHRTRRADTVDLGDVALLHGQHHLGGGLAQMPLDRLDELHQADRPAAAGGHYDYLTGETDALNRMLLALREAQGKPDFDSTS